MKLEYIVTKHNYKTGGLTDVYTLKISRSADENREDAIKRVLTELLPKLDEVLLKTK